MSEQQHADPDPPDDRTRSEVSRVVKRFRAAAKTWRAHVIIVPPIGSQPARALLNLADLMVLPANGVCTDSIHVETDPNPSTQDLWRLAMDPAVQAFGVIAINLADTLKPLAEALEGWGIDSTKTLGLERELRRLPRRPLVTQEAKLSDIEIQVDRMVVRNKKRSRDGDSAIAHNGRKQNKRPEPSSPLTFPPLLTWHGVNWQPLRRDLELSGDEEGLARLDARLPRLRDEHHSFREEVIDGKVVGVYSTGWCAASLLDWFRDRRSAQWMLSQLAPALQIDTSTSVGVCERWRALATWVPRFARGGDGQGVLGFGEGAREDRKIGGVPSPHRTWASAFRDTTAALVPLMRDKEDIPVHRLLRLIDKLLCGETVRVTDILPEVEVLVRAAHARALTIPSGTQGTSAVHHPVGGAQAVPLPQPAAPTPPVLKFPREPDAKQKCLEALDAAPDGIPTHEAIARVVELEVQTVKEAMGKLKKAGYVKKSARLRGWIITVKGQKHLQILRGK